MAPFRSAISSTSSFHSAQFLSAVFLGLLGAPSDEFTDGNQGKTLSGDCDKACSGRKEGKYACAHGTKNGCELGRE